MFIRHTHVLFCFLRLVIFEEGKITHSIAPTFLIIINTDWVKKCMYVYVNCLIKMRWFLSYNVNFGAIKNNLLGIFCKKF